MSTVDRPGLAPLIAGQRLSQAAFHEAYEAMPENFWAELVGGVVYVSSPVKDRHGIVSGDAVTWLNLYKYRTSGAMVGDNVSTVLDDDNEVQPDVLMRILPDYGGQSTTINGIIQGAPELVIEVSRSSKAFDLGIKLLEYERAGVKEYLVFAIDPDEVFWHELQGNRLVRIKADPDGIYRSKVFPGLWLDPAALFAEDGLALIATLERGLASPGHPEFVRELQARKIQGGLSSPQ
jgi:Uma2 family endonuclease